MAEPTAKSKSQRKGAKTPSIAKKNQIVFAFSLRLCVFALKKILSRVGARKERHCSGQRKIAVSRHFIGMPAWTSSPT
ncbi:MAG: hypothetical protein LBL69_02705 [Zoogloeaceae bacterium]|jgi:hypothetical protein|nr:hypothetical protein [Zoogloeaceae bacterium]